MVLMVIMGHIYCPPISRHSLFVYISVVNMQADLNNGANCEKSHDLSSNNSILLNLELTTILGVNSYERLNSQKIVFDARIIIDKNHVITPHLIHNIKQSIVRHFTKEQPYLLERMAYIIAYGLASNYPELVFISLTIKKPTALANARNASVTLIYEKNS